MGITKEQVSRGLDAEARAQRQKVSIDECATASLYSFTLRSTKNGSFASHFPDEARLMTLMLTAVFDGARKKVEDEYQEKMKSI